MKDKKEINYFRKKFREIWEDAIEDTKEFLKKSEIINTKIFYTNGKIEDIYNFYIKWNETWKEFLEQNYEYDKLDEKAKNEIIEAGSGLTEEFSIYF